MIILILGAILMLGVCIFVHELGHLLCGMAVGVKARIFSIGYGKGVWKKRIGKTVYQITRFPFGGYVMFQGDQYGKRLKGKEGELLSTPPLKRMIPVIGGPLFNLLLGFILFYILALLGDTPPISKVFIDPSYAEESPAYRAGLRNGDKIVSVNGQKTESFEDVAASVGLSRETEIKIEYERDGKVENTTVFTEVYDEDKIPTIGIEAYGKRNVVVTFTNKEQLLHFFKKVFAKVFPKEYTAILLDSENAKLPKKEKLTTVQIGAIAYLNDGDEIKEVEDKKVSTVGELQSLLGKNQDKLVKVKVLRKRFPLLIPWAKEETIVNVPVRGASVLELSNITDHKLKSLVIRKFQLLSYDPEIDQKLNNLQVDDNKFTKFSELEKYLSDLDSNSISIEVGGNKFKTNYRIRKIGLLGFRPSMKFDPERMEARAGVLEAAIFASKRIYSDIINSLRGIGMIFTGMISASENLAGPVRIVEFAGLSLQDGLFTYLDFVARISIALMITNLLPLPVADGGHLVLYFFEAITGKPLPPKAIEWIFKAGFMFLLSLLLFVTYNDITRAFR